MSVFGDLNAETALFLQRATEKQARQRFLETLARDPEGAHRLATLVSQWGDKAPTLPTGAIMGMAQGAVGPMGPVGQKVIEKAVPVSKPQRTPTIQQSIQQMPEVPSVPLGPDTPGAGPLAGAAQTIERNIGQPVGNVLSRARFAGDPTAASARALVDPNAAQAEAAGGPPVKPAVRLAGALANDAARIVQTPIALAAAATATVKGHPQGGVVHGPFGSTWEVGSIADTLDPKQLSTYQAVVEDRSLGQGWLPDGTATKAAAEEQRQAGAINGHAMTYGRSIAGVATPPGSRLNLLASGTVDMFVASKADPVSHLLGAWSKSAAAASEFAPSSEMAIANAARYLTHDLDAPKAAIVREWVGRSADFPIIDSITDSALPESVLSHASFHDNMIDELDRLGGMKLTAIERETVDEAKALVRETSGEYTPGNLRLGLTSQNPNAPEILDQLSELAARHGAPADLADALAAKIAVNPHGGIEIAEKIGKSPQQLLRALVAEQAGVHWAFRPILKQQSYESWLAGQGKDVLGHMVRETSISRMQEIKGLENVPVSLLAELTRADSDEAIRAIVAREAGVNIAGPLGVRYTRPLSNLRLFSLIPSEDFDLSNPQQMFEQAKRTMIAEKFPRDRWDEILMPIAEGKMAGAQGEAILHKLDNGIRDHMVGIDNKIISTVAGTNDKDAIRAAVGSVRQRFGHAALTDLQVERLARMTNEDNIREMLSDQVGLGPVPYKIATKLTRSYRDRANVARQFYLDEMGEVPRVPNPLVNGETMQIDGPFRHSELANRTIPMVDGRGIRQATTKWRQFVHLWNDGALTEIDEPMSAAKRARVVVNIEAHASAFLTKSFKSVVLWPPRLAAMILGDEQGRMAASGLDSLFRDPFSAHAIANARKFDLDAKGIDWATELGKAQSAIARAAGERNPLTPAWYSAESAIASHFDTFTKGQDGYLSAWVDRLTNAHMDAASKEVAKAIIDPAHVASEESGIAGLDGVKEWWWHGAGAAEREDLAAAGLQWGDINSAQLTDRTVADWYIDQAGDRLMVETGGDEHLLDAVANGTPFHYEKAHLGVHHSVDADFRDYLRDMASEIGPQKVTGKALMSARRKGMLRAGMDAYFDFMVDQPTQKFSRIVTFKQSYWKDVQRMMPRATPEAQEQLLQVARNSRVPLKAVAQSGDIGIETIDKVANLRALAFTREFLDYPGETTTLEDILRNVIPFGRAYRDAVAAWVKIIKKSPQVARRVQQGIQEGKQLGVIAPDPSRNNDDVVTIFGAPMARAMTSALGMAGVGGGVGETTGAEGFSLVGALSGANIVARGIPGAGYGVQLGVEHILPKGGIFDVLRDVASPYGAPDLSTGFFESLAPGVIDSFRASGWLSGIGYEPTAQQKVTYDNFAMSAFQTMFATGSYNTSDPNVLADMVESAKHQATRLYILRGLGQAFIPTALHYQAKMRIPDGRAIELFVIGDEYYKKLTELHGDVDGATKWLLNKFGTAAIYSTVPKSIATTTGLPTDKAGETFVSQNKRFVSKYKSVYGFFVPQKPQGADNNIDLHYQQIKDGTRKALPVEDWVALVNDKIGRHVVDVERQRLPASLNDRGLQHMRDFEHVQTVKYPGFAVTIPDLPTPVERQEKIDILTGRIGRAALEDPAVRDTPIAQAARFYLGKRQEILDREGRQSLTGERMRRYRDALYGIGTQVVEQTPEFSFMWDRLLSREVSPDAR